jgi:cytoskeletal protein CcmA (bactofilin family)
MFFKSAGSNDKARLTSSGRAAAPSILSVDLQILGDVASSGEVHISGTVKGDVSAKKLTIGEGGAVIGAVLADSVLIAGTLTGRVTATTVTLGASARVVADITHVSLIIEPGAVFEGYSRRVDAIGQAESTLPLALPASSSTVTPITSAKGGAQARAEADEAPSPATASS